MTVLRRAIEDLFDPRLTVAEAADRHFAPGFRQRVDGGDWIDRDAFLAGLAAAREAVAGIEVTVLDELAEGERYAERHVIALVAPDGGRTVNEVYVFARRDAGGRFAEIEEATVARGA